MPDGQACVVIVYIYILHTIVNKILTEKNEK